MKEFIQILIGEDTVKDFKSLPSRKAKLVFIYFAASFCFMLIGACCTSVLFILLCLGNMANALRLAYKYIPDFNTGD